MLRRGRAEGGAGAAPQCRQCHGQRCRCTPPEILACGGTGEMMAARGRRESTWSQEEGSVVRRGWRGGGAGSVNAARTKPPPCVAVEER